MKVAVITPLFSLAGVPLAQQRMATALARKGFEVDMIIGYLDPQFEYHSPVGVNTIVLNKKRVRGFFFPLIKYVLKNKPQIIFSAEDHLNIVVLFALIFSGSHAKVSCSSRVTPFDTYRGYNTILTKGWILRLLMRVTMPRADVLTCVSKDMVLQYKEVFANSCHQYAYNIISCASIRESMIEPVSHPWLLADSVPVLIAAGRLAPWKGFDTLLRAVDCLKLRRRVRLIILGDGPQRDELLGLAHSLKLDGIVDFLGYVRNPLKYFYRADVFVLSSIVEGMPNVLLEAMACGCTPVATNCPTGPAEILGDGRAGYLTPVGDPEAMASSIDRALNSPISKENLYSALTPFGESEVLKRHFNLLRVCL